MTETPPGEGEPSDSAPESVPETAATPPVTDVIAARIRSKGTLGICAMCSTADWQVGWFVPISVSTKPLGLQLGGRMYPLVAIICRNCGNTHFLNLSLLGFTTAELEAMQYPESEP